MALREYVMDLGLTSAWMGWDIEAWKNDEVLNEPLPPA
jgi:hypothetical protein